MKRIDRLLQKAKERFNATIEHLFPGDADGFMDALGVDKDKYKVEYPNGEVGYDFLKALADTARKDWGDYEQESRRLP